MNLGLGCKNISGSYWASLNTENITEQRSRDFVFPTYSLSTLLYHSCIVSILNILVSYDNDNVWLQQKVCCFYEKMPLMIIKRFIVLFTTMWNSWRALVHRLLAWPVPHREHFGYEPSQWETLKWNVVSHWLGVCTIWSLPHAMYDHEFIRMANWVLNRMIRYMGTWLWQEIDRKHRCILSNRWSFK